MKKRKFVIAFIASMLWCSCAIACTPIKESEKTNDENPVCEEWIHPDKMAYDILGRRLTDVLMNAKKINVYSLVPKEKINSDDYEVEPHFVRHSQIGTLTKEQAVVLKYTLISNGANYHNDSTFIIMSPYCPVIEFEFIKKKEVAHLIISLSDFKWAVKYDDKIQFKYNYATGTFIKRFCEYFLKQNDDNK